MDPKPAQESQSLTQSVAVQTPEKPITQPLEATPSTESTPMPKNGHSMGKVLFLFIAVILLILVGGSSYYLGTQQGKSQQLQEVLQKTKENLAKEAQITKIPLVTPTEDPTASWSAYVSTKYMYSVKYPTNLTPNEQNTYYHYVEFNPAGSHVLPTFLTAVIADTFVAKDIPAYNYMSSDFINNLSAMKTGDTKTDNGTVFTKLASVMVDGQDATVVELTTTGPKQRRVYVKKNGYLYMLSNSFQTAGELSNFTLFLSSFKFTP